MEKLLYQPDVIHEIKGRDFATVDDLHRAYVVSCKALDKTPVHKAEFYKHLERECYAQERVKTEKGEWVLTGVFMDTVIDGYNSSEHRLHHAKVIKY